MKYRHPISRRFTGAAFALALVSLVTGSHGATSFKENNADNLNLASSWDVVPGAADVALWDSAVVAANSPLLGADLSWAGIKINDPGGLVTLGAGNTLTLGSSGIDLSTATQNLTIASGLTLLGKQSWSAAADRTLDVTGTFTRTGAVVDFTNFNAAATLGTLVNANGILGTWATTGSTTALKYVTSTSGAISAYAGATAASANLANVTSATENYKYSAAATPTGSLTCNTLQYTGAATTTALGTNGLTLNGLMNSGTGNLTITGTAGANPGLVIGSSGELNIISNDKTIIIGSVISGTGTVTYSGAGTITLNSLTNTYTGNTYLNSGILGFAAQTSDTPTPVFGTGSLTINKPATLFLNRTNLTTNLTFNGGTLQVGNSFVSALSGTVTLGATTTFNISGTGGIRLTNNVSGPGGLTKIGTSTLPLNGLSNTYTGPTIVNDGFLVVKSSLYGNDPLKWTPENITVAGAGTLVLNVAGTNEFTVEQAATMFGNLTTVDNNGLKDGSAVALDTTNASAATTTFSTVLTDSTGSGGGAVGFKKRGSKTLELTGENTYSGKTSIQPTVGNTLGSLSVATLNSVATNETLGTVHSDSSNLGAPTTVATGTIDLGFANAQAPATLIYTGTGETTDRVINFPGNASSTGTIDHQGTGLLKFTSPFTKTNAAATPIALQGPGNGEIVSALPALGNLTKAGTGTWTLGGANLHTGITTVSGGCLVLNHATAIKGGIAATGGLAAITFNGGVIGLGEGDFSRNLAAAGTVTGVTFTGNGGWAAYNANRAVNLGGAAAPITWATQNGGLNGKTLILGNATATHTVDFQNPLDLGAATRTVQVDDGAAAIDGKLSGSLTNGNLTKTGPGTLALTGSNSYAGATTVSAGTLLVNGTNSGTGMITAASGASLGGTGSIAGPVTFNTGSTAVFTVTRDPVTQANTTPLTVTGAMDFWDTEIHLNVPADLPSGVYTLATSSATPIGTIVTTPVLDSGTYAPGVTSAEVSLDVINNRLLLTVNGLPTHPTKLAITSVNGGVSPFAGAGFNVVVQAQDVNGASRQALTDTSVKLSLNTGSGPLGGTLNGVIPAGAVSVTISGVTYGTAASGVVLAAARTSGDLLTGGNSAPFTVLPGTLPAYLVVSGFPSPQTAGSPGSVTVTAKTAIGTTATTYTGTVHFTSTAVAAGLPTDYTFVGSDNGVHTFSGVTLNTAGMQSITATDMVSPTITGTQSDIAVTAAAATSLVVAGYPSPRLASVADSVTVTAKDAYGNTAPSYTGTIQFTSSDGTASLPGNYTFTGGDAGTHTFITGVTLNTLGVQSITATDLAAPSITGTQSGITVWVPPTSFSWRSPAANGNWSDATKWAQSSNLDYAPVTTGQSDYILNFIAGTYAANQNLSNGFLVNQLNFAGTVTVDGANGLALAGTLPTINQNSANVVTINPPVSLTTGATVAGSGNGQVNLAGLISGASSLTKSNPGMLKIYGLVPNTYSGGTIINSGTLHIGTINPDGQSPFCVGVLGTGSVTLGSGTTLELDRVSADNTLISNGGTIFSNNGWGSTWTGPITLNTNTTFNIQYKMSCSGGISGTGGVIKTGADTLTLSGTLNYTGNTTVSGGILSINSAYLADASTVTIATGAKLDLNTAGASDTITTLVLGGVTVPTGTYNATHPTYGLYFSGSGSLVVGSDYNTWLAGFTFAEGANTTPTGDPDGDGVNNQEEYAFGLNPTLATSVSPIIAQFNPATGNFQYTRRATPAATKLTYNVLTSSDLATWATGGATETGFTTAGNIETVTVNVTTPAVGGKLFVRVEAVPAP